MDQTKKNLLELIPLLAGRPLLVIGDLFLDEYVFGLPRRLSREAPIPVLEFSKHVRLPGGAANPAYNIQALGGRATIVGVIGDDDAGGELLKELDRAGIDASGVVLDKSRPTTTKTRIMAEDTLRFPQQVARLDHVDRRPLDPEVADAVTQHIADRLAGADAVLMSDYQTGVADPRVVQALRPAICPGSRWFTVDAQGSFDKYAGFHLVKGNRHEISVAVGHLVEGEDDYRQSGQALLKRLGAHSVLVTRGDEGMSVISRDGSYLHIPAANRSEVFDVTGAGDTVIAVSTLALAAGATVARAATLANYAAGLVVRKLGNAVVTPEELAWAVENW